MDVAGEPAPIRVETGKMCHQTQSIYDGDITSTVY